MITRLLAVGFVLLSAGQAFGQSSPIEISATGLHEAKPGDSPELASQLALADARRKVWQAAGARLRGHPAAKNLAMPAPQIDAYLAALLVVERAAPAPARAGARATEVTLRTVLDVDRTLASMAALRKDQDTTRELLAAWARHQRQYDAIDALTNRRADADANAATAIADQQQRLAAALEAAHLTAQATAAMVRTVEGTVGGRAPTEEGRLRARKLIEAALALSPESPDAHAALGDWFIEAEQPEAAEGAFRAALKAAPDSVSIRTRLAEAVRLQGRFDEAVAELRQAIAIDPGYAQTHADLGLVLRAQRKFPEAVAEYREALRLERDSVDAHNGLAVTFANQGELDSAVAEFREIVRVDPDSTIGYYNLAFALAQLDRDEESAAALREVIRINPNHYNARFNLGELFRLDGKYDDAVTQFREFLRLAPDQPQNQRNIQRARGYIDQLAEP